MPKSPESMNKCQVYVHIALLGNVQNFLTNILNRFFTSGLYDYADIINLCFVGDLKNIDTNIVNGSKYKICHVSTDTLQHESPTLKKIWQDAQNQEADILYLHSKGIDEYNNQNINDWLEYLLYYNIDLWYFRVVELNGCDVTGVNLNHQTENNKELSNSHSGLYYCGNFWWSKYAHIRNLSEPIFNKDSSLVSSWICSRDDSTYAEVHNSKINHNLQAYKKEFYVEVNKPKVDVIFLTKTSSFHHYGLTQRSVNSLLYNNKNVDFNIIIVETNSHSYLDGYYYNGCTVVHPDEDFNYNKFVKIGLKFCNSKFVLICNNDLIFTENCIVNMLASMQRNNINSSCPVEPNYHPRSCSDLDYNSGPIEGYVVTKHICGWCICINRKILNEYDDFFDDRFAFWYQDNDYALTLQNKNIKHYLLPNFKVRHEFCGSHDLLGDHVQQMTHGQLDIFKSKWPNY